MQVYQYPERDTWGELLKRPVLDTASLEATVQAILSDVRETGDEAVRRYALKFDKASLGELRVSPQEMDAAVAAVDPALREAIRQAAANITKFHAAQKEEVKVVETMPGVRCWRKSVPLDKVGLYIPGGTAPLFSTILMLAIPASLAGCRRIVLCTPPDAKGGVNPVMLFAAALTGVTEVYRIGGVPAIAAMAYGTESVPRVDKIFGPGNQYVTCAKQLVSRAGTPIDMPAGPSEVAVLADDSCNAAFVAADLLSQAEHGIDSQVLLVTTEERVIREVEEQLALQLQDLPRREIAAAALAHSRAVLAGSLEEGVELINAYAPEHLIISTEKDEQVAEGILYAGSIFLGNYSPESAGDYASGTNHTLPTHGYARTYSGVSLDSFLRKMTFQKLSPEGLKTLGPVVEQMAAAEGLEAHRRAVTIRNGSQPL
jgi:histidinol dehydrogenase